MNTHFQVAGFQDEKKKKAAQLDAKACISESHYACNFFQGFHLYKLFTFQDYYDPQK